jgi:hypothetical protein
MGSPNAWNEQQMLALRAAYNQERNEKGVKSESLFGRPGVITPEQNNMGVAVGSAGYRKKGLLICSICRLLISLKRSH